jgi:N-acyl-D-aspartate/D-glutamate deacylase
MLSTGILVVLLATTGQVEADIVFENVTIHDGSLSAPFQGRLAIRGQRIAAVGDFEVEGQPRTIDANGFIAAPGFIDLHNHSDGTILDAKTRLNKNYLTQGVTTIVTGNCGGGQVDVADYLSKIDEQGAGTNVAHLIPHGSVRSRVMGIENRPPAPSEIEQMQVIFRAGMESGAVGMSTGLIYVPSKYAETQELIALATTVASHGGIYVSHMRNENTGLLESIEEILEIGRQASIPVHVSHFKASGRAAWGLAAEAIRVLDEARGKGQRVTADQYPYIASSTSLGAMVVPDVFRESSQLKAALADPQRRETVKRQIRDAIETRSGGASLFVASYANDRSWQGRDLATLGREQQRSVLEIVLEIQTNGGAQMVNFGMDEQEVRLIMQQPFVAVASDGNAKNPDDTMPHPRNYGTFPRKIGEYAIRRQIVSVAHAIHSATGLPAAIIGLTDRGVLRAGAYADVVIFDPEAMVDNATFDQPDQYASGVRYLLVNGVFAIESGEVTGRQAGRAVRRPK